jgi:hypothetical protein
VHTTVPFNAGSICFRDGAERAWKIPWRRLQSSRSISVSHSSSHGLIVQIFNPSFQAYMSCCGFSYIPPHSFRNLISYTCYIEFRGNTSRSTQTSSNMRLRLRCLQKKREESASAHQRAIRELQRVHADADVPLEPSSMPASPPLRPRSLAWLKTTKPKFQEHVNNAPVNPAKDIVKQTIKTRVPRTCNNDGQWRVLEILEHHSEKSEPNSRATSRCESVRLSADGPSGAAYVAKKSGRKGKGKGKGKEKARAQAVTI